MLSRQLAILAVSGGIFGYFLPGMGLASQTKYQFGMPKSLVSQNGMLFVRTIYRVKTASSGNRVVQRKVTVSKGVKSKEELFYNLSSALTVVR